MTKAMHRDGKSGRAAGEAAGKAKAQGTDGGELGVPKVKLTRMGRLAIWITRHVGTMGFFLAVFAWTVGWLFWNMFAPKSLRFDPFPGFVLWLFISNMIQLFLMPLIMVGQNLQGRHAEERAKSDYKINLKAEKEIKEIQDQLAEILERLEEMKGRGQ